MSQFYIYLCFKRTFKLAKGEKCCTFCKFVLQYCTLLENYDYKIVNCTTAIVQLCVIKKRFSRIFFLRPMTVAQLASLVAPNLVQQNYSTKACFHSLLMRCLIDVYVALLKQQNVSSELLLQYCTLYSTQLFCSIRLM